MHLSVVSKICADLLSEDFGRGRESAACFHSMFVNAIMFNTSGTIKLAKIVIELGRGCQFSIQRLVPSKRSLGPFFCQFRRIANQIVR